jgi:hypothetical protein
MFRKMKNEILTIAALALLSLTSCSNDDDATTNNANTNSDQAKTFRLTLKNAVNYLSVKKIGDGPLTTTGAYHEVSFKATKGTYLSFANMFAQSNDWFFGTNSQGIKLWDGDTPRTGDISSALKVWDAGSEQDEAFLTDFPSTLYTAPNQSAANSGPADSDNTVRDTGRNILNYLWANLTYDATTKYFTLKIVKADREALHNPGFITPGILVIHTQDNALFEAGAPLKSNGLEGLAEDGSPMAIYQWFKKEGSAGAPLRLSSSMSVLSPSVAYVHQGEQSPLFTKGAAAVTTSGLKELAEDGNPNVAYNYLNGLENVTAFKSDNGATPGQEITFEVQAKPGYKLNFATMFVSSNDWFISNNQQGIELFNEDGTVKTEFTVNKNYLYDSGTEEDQTVGLGNGQPMNGNASVGIDADTTVRRVTTLDDVQFGKGVISSAAGVTQQYEERGGYNLIKVTVEEIN